MTTLTRRELYDLVWATPMIKLAEQFGLSDVGLTKVCDRHRVPTPPRGYWAKQSAGKSIKQTIFTEVDDPFLNRIEIASSRDRLPEPVREIVERRRAERKRAPSPQQARLIKPIDGLAVAEPHPAIRATAKALRGANLSPAGVIEAVGPGLCGVSASRDNVERIVRFLDRLARTCEQRHLLLVPAGNRVSVSVGKDEVTFEIKEKTRQAPHGLTQAEIAAEEKRRRRSARSTHRSSSWDDYEMFAPAPPRFDVVRTGEFGLEIHGWGDGLQRSWRDGKFQTLETLIDGIVDGLEAHIAAHKHHREARERAEAERQELARRRGLAKARRERESNRRVLLSKLIRAERQAKQIRSWISACEQHTTEGVESDLGRMIGWARNQLEALEAILDPITLADELRERKLFPEIDELQDPQS
jgi:hypothetical protein